MTGKSVADLIKAISQACASLPVLDERSADDILGYNDIGLPE
ncbi:MAG: type II toxin-antitoxin system VapB family antitoxin [Leptolyngbyaceae cyanobacterium SM2_5_2]|nr:type II toxin-antitoxin system VapB family antitoxin [Leptolyngbyaceae cyanobacterium SM2_5_2]